MIKLKGDKYVSIIAVQLAVTDYDKWRVGFDKYHSLRSLAGITASSVYRNADNSNEILVWNETTDVNKSREAISGPDVQKAMQESGVIGPPKIHVMP